VPVPVAVGSTDRPAAGPDPTCILLPIPSAARQYSSGTQIAGSAALQSRSRKRFSARVIAAAGSRWKLEKVRALGVDERIDHREQDVLEEVRRLTDKRGVDIVVDHVDSATWQSSLKSLVRGGRPVTCATTTGGEAPTNIRYIYGRRLSIRGTWMGSKGKLCDLMRLVEEGRLKPVVHPSVPWEEAVRTRGMELRKHLANSS
jgi:NADPH:quinone reductase-like Zn-dependent oxidoreductase